jgi:hypothetical protein
MGQMGRKVEGAGGVGFFPFSFILAFVFPFFLFTLFDSNLDRPQIQISTSKNYAPSKNGI